MGHALLFSSGCRNDMYQQAKFKPFDPSTFFENGSSARPLVAGTIPHEDPRGNPPAGIPESVYTTGWNGNKLAEEVPFPVDRDLLERGQNRFRIYCTPCHGELGDGRGIVVRRGFNAPPSYTSDELLHKPIGHFVDVITRGHGTMVSYAARVAPRDRWAIASYVRAIQLSQHAKVDELEPQDRNGLTVATTPDPQRTNRP
jgi:mono/diheme cytochrome c family protein